MARLFSVIIPAYNAADSVATAVRSAFGQTGITPDAIEVIVVDDCSTDGTAAVLAALAAAHPELRRGRTPSNGGPGAARNIGLDLARGDWLLFVDSDDQLAPTALAQLQQLLLAEADEAPEAIGFDWCFLPPAGAPLPDTGRRRDRADLDRPRGEMLRRYLRLQMDGSVIYTAIRRSLVSAHGLRFAAGYHEDVDFIFKVYWHAGRIAYLDSVLYFKQQRAASIVNTISVRHLQGFIRAWGEIAAFIAAEAPARWPELLPDWQRGLSAVIATRLREIFRRTSSAETAAPLYAALHRLLATLPAPPATGAGRPPTQYEHITDYFLPLMGTPAIDPETAATQLSRFLEDTVTKTWSCIDLHHSVFLAPNQVRTCCKRFFVAGQMRGDVPLLDSPPQNVSAASIRQAKQALHERINKGEATPCTGCPFMEFKEWGRLDRLDIRYLSLEYHSVCNLKCTYCSDTYYGGLPPQYAIAPLIDELLAGRALDACHTIVWGGGEPVVDKHFTPLIEKLAERLPQAGQRVLTNAVKYSKTVERLLGTGQVAVTTSIDAGSSRTFDLVRGKAKLRNVLNNLTKYAAIASERVTVKYIFTADNHALDEVRGFAGLITEHRLTDCNFQISSDFKEEAVSPTVALAMIVMYGLLSRAGCQVIFFDDLLRHRLSDILAGHEVEIRARLAALGLADSLADPAAYPAVIIWGAGWQARYLLERAAFFKRVEVAFFVDQTPAKIGTTYFDRPVRPPTALCDSELPVVIAAAQGFPAIYRNFLDLGIARQRLIRQLIL
ncbi:MAG: hypothetical protein H6R15_2280 [Proteobacteria bacterium]|nr:hypothetical protein [Pseudomonadota bacterium]